MHQSYRSERSVETLTGVLHVISHAFQCPTPSCPLHHGHLRPEAEDVLALRGYTFGLDVVAHIGDLRFAQGHTIPKMHHILHQA